MQTFKLTLELLTPFVLNSPLTLDGLLSAAIFNQTGKTGRDTLPLIPLDSDQGIFRGSSLHVPRSFRHEAVGRVMSLRTERDLSPELFAPNKKRGGGYGFIDQKRGDYKANMNSYQGIQAKEAYFWGVGDAEACAELIRNHIPGIGKRSNAGAGEIGAVFVEPSEDYSWVTTKGTPARPLPVEIWQTLGFPVENSMPLAVRLPYWETEPVDAVFPISLVV